MLKKIYRLLLIILISTIFPASAHSGSDWQITLKVSGGGIYDYCIAGVKDGATDGHDNAWDIPAPPSSRNEAYINAYFPHPEWNHVFERFRQDIKAPDLPKEWTFEVVSNIIGKFTIQWSDIKNEIPDKEATLVDIDGTGGEIDMHSSSSFVFGNTGFPRIFLVRISESIPVPEPPEGLVGKLIKLKRGKGRAVLLDWKENHKLDLAGYNVYRSSIPGSSYKRINYLLIAGHSFLDEQVVKNQTYYYVVTAVNDSGGESGYSNEVEVIVAKGKVGKGKVK